MRALRWYIARPRLAVAVAVVLTLVAGVVDALLFVSARGPSAAVATTAQQATNGVSNSWLGDASVGTLPDGSACIWIGNHHAC